MSINLKYFFLGTARKRFTILVILPALLSFLSITLISSASQHDFTIENNDNDSVPSNVESSISLDDLSEGLSSIINIPLPFLYFNVWVKNNFYGLGANNKLVSSNLNVEVFGKYVGNIKSGHSIKITKIKMSDYHNFKFTYSLNFDSDHDQRLTSPNGKIQKSFIKIKPTLSAFLVMWVSWIIAIYGITLFIQSWFKFLKNGF